MFPKGLSTTRFHKGFQRRKQSNIMQDASRLQREAFKQHVSVLHLERRRQRLGSLDKRNGFNLITGQFDANRRCTTPFHVQPRTRETGSLSKEAERAEYLLLRDSEYKFHAPAWSGKNHDERQDLLQREGLNKPKKSTLLGIGTADLASAGANDMFSKSIYDPAKTCAVEGLVEACVPGRYTPRKVTSARRAAAAAAAPGDDAPALRQVQENSGQRSCSSPAALNTVFRVVPNGLGNHSTVGGRGGATVAGIAPYKRLCGSRSTPTMRSREHKAEMGTGTPFRKSFPMRSPSPGGGSRRHTGSGGEDGRGAGSVFAERLLSATSESARRGSRELARSHSDFGGSSGRGQTQGEARATTAGTEGFVEKTASSEDCTRRFLGEGGPGSARLSRGQSPAERRSNEQLTLDLATIRSL
ncbi:unnamed protein product [Ectocarpus sp. 13 AM-2016]